AYIAQSTSSSKVGVLDTSTNTITANVTTPSAVCFSPDGSKAYVPNTGSGSVSVINTWKGTVSATVTVGSSPVSVGFRVAVPVRAEATSGGSPPISRRSAIIKAESEAIYINAQAILA